MGRRLAVQDVMRPPVACLGCGTMIDQSWGKVRYCKVECSRNAAKRRRYQALPVAVRSLSRGYQPVPEQNVPCVSCSAPVARRGNENKRFCAACRPLKGHFGRAQHYGVPFERFDRLTVFVRDGWICQLCHRAVDKSLPWPNLDSASLDHIVSVSKGGGHVESNVQLAHLGCNISKGANIINEGV